MTASRRVRCAFVQSSRLPLSLRFDYAKMMRFDSDWGKLRSLEDQNVFTIVPISLLLELAFSIRAVIAKRVLTVGGRVCVNGLPLSAADYLHSDDEKQPQCVN